MSRPDISDYALIGDLHTAALVSRGGSIDWLCLPRFDSPACFAGLLHDDSAGCWSLAPAAQDARLRRRAYREDSLILDTEWEADTGAVRVTDFMPPRSDGARVVRVVTGLRGRVTMHMRLVMRFDYGRITPWLRHHERGLTAIAGPDALYLDSPVPVHGRDDVSFAECGVEQGRSVAFVLHHQASNVERSQHCSEPNRALEMTETYWRNWTSTCTYDGEWQSEVRRALITLKALTYAPTGGVVAAATTSLPEAPGGSRNWDYRYCWLRDTAFTLQALLVSGYVDEARAWREWSAGSPATARTNHSRHARASST